MTKYPGERGIIMEKINKNTYPGTDNDTYDDIVEIMHIRNLLYWFLNLRMKEKICKNGKPHNYMAGECTACGKINPEWIKKNNRLSELKNNRPDLYY